MPSFGILIKTFPVYPVGCIDIMERFSACIQIDKLAANMLINVSNNFEIVFY